MFIVAGSAVFGADRMDPSPSSTSEAEVLVRQLMERAADGDRSAFGAIYQRCSPAVFRFLRRRVESPIVAEDLTSETFARALQRVSAFEWQGKDPVAWLLTIARNLYADHVRSVWVQRVSVDDDLVVEVDDAHAGPEETAIRAVDGAADADSLASAISFLTSDQQLCLALRYAKGLSIHQVAVAMGRSGPAAKALHRRAVMALRRNRQLRETAWSVSA